MELFFGGTSGTGEDHWAGRVSRAHGTEEKRDKDKRTPVCMCAFRGPHGGSQSVIQNRGYGHVKEQ